MLSIPKNKNVCDSKEFEFINKEGYRKIEHYSWTDKSNLYGHYRVLSTMLIDQNGKIVYVPEFSYDRNLEQDFEDLLAGKEISVEKKGPKRIELSQD